MHNPSSHAIQPVLHTTHLIAAYLTAGQLVQWDAVRNSIKSHTEIQTNYVHHLPFIHQMGDLFVEEYQISKTGLSLCEPMLPVPVILSYSNLHST